jgi:hypothetical protein
MLNPERTIFREFGEELLACDHKKRLLYTFRAEDEQGPGGVQREALKAWGRRMRDKDFSEYTRLPTPMKWIAGPDRVRVKCGNHIQETDGYFLNITPEDNAIEVDRIGVNPGSLRPERDWG